MPVVYRSYGRYTAAASCQKGDTLRHDEKSVRLADAVGIYNKNLVFWFGSVFSVSGPSLQGM